MSSSKGRVFKLRISNEEILEVEEAAAMLSGTFKQLAEDITEDEIPLPVAEPGILGMVPKVMEWCQKHAKGKATEEDLKEWDANFVNVDEATLYWLFLAADYLDVKELVGQAAQRTADMIKGKKPHQIREFFKIKDDMDPEVVKKVQQENPFVEF